MSKRTESATHGTALAHVETQVTIFRRKVETTVHCFTYSETKDVFVQSQNSFFLCAVTTKLSRVLGSFSSKVKI